MGAFIRSLICVNAEVVEEVVPLSKVFPAIFVIAFKNFYDSLGLRILQTVNFKLLSAWNMLLNLD